MGVLVCYDDFTYDVINDYHLDYLLERGCITGYDNSGNWVKTEDLPQDTRALAAQATQSPGVPDTR
ncbi:MAG TPA: hypothetical protein VIK40_04015 [Geomonas sp.]